MSLDIGTYKIKKVNLLVTKNCNLHCRMCDYPIAASSEEQISLSDIEKLITDAHDLGLEQLEISGGEPMLRKDIYEIIRFANSLNIKTIMMTNGVLIGENEAERLVGSGLNEIALSLEGFAEVNDKLRGNGNFLRVMNAISYLRKQKEQLDCIRVGVTISKFNYTSLFSFVKYLHEELGINSISLNPFNRYMLTPESYEGSKHEFDITSGELPDLCEQIEKIIQYSEHRDISYLTKDFLNMIPDYFKGKSMIPQSGCNQPSVGCPIDSYGNVYTCWGEVLHVGNIKENSIKDITASEKYQKFCSNALVGKCKGCLSTCYVY